MALVPCMMEDCKESTTRTINSAKAMTQHANGSYLGLLFLASIIVLLNLNQMHRLEHISPPYQWYHSLTLDFSTKAIPAYFQAPTRLRKPLPKRKGGIQTNLVKGGDFVYYKSRDRWDSAPIVLESHRLIFFTIPKAGCTVWKQLFRRMMGYVDWNVQDETTLVPHNPETNGLKYLSDYTPKQASEMMTSPEWTRAIMVRDPKERFLSAFLDKSVSNDHRHIIGRCCTDESCVEDAQTLPGFLKLCASCDDDHWRPQHQRMEVKYWPYIDHVLHVETAANDARRLLTTIGAWDDYGQTGWGSDGDLSIFQSKDRSGAGVHATFAQWQVWKWYTPESEIQVEQFYQCDYENPLLNFTRALCLTCK